MLLAIDQGTTNTKALLIARDGATAFTTSAPTPLAPSDGDFIDQDPELLFASTLQVLRSALAWAQAHNHIVEGLALTNQRETAVAWDRESGEALAPAISWQCRRSAPVCQAPAVASAAIQERSGLPLDPLLSATKWAWLISSNDRVQQAERDGTLALGTVDSWLLYRLTAGRVHATDTTNASRTGLLNLKTLQWDADLLSAFRIDPGCLPRVCASASNFEACDHALDAGELPIVAICGDSHAALLGHGTTASGTIKATYGTGSSLMAAVDGLPAPTAHLARTVAWSLPSADLPNSTAYALEGNITMSGAALEWASRFLGLDTPAAAADLADTVSASDGVTFVPAMAGLGAPHWNARATGMLTGLRPHHTRAHMARAALEAIAHQVADVFDAMQNEGELSLTALRADGGATRNAALMQLQADLLGVPVLRSTQEELSALGVARLGGLTLGWWPTLAAATVLDRPIETFTSRIGSGQRAARRTQWKSALRRALLEDTAQ